MKRSEILTVAVIIVGGLYMSSMFIGALHEKGEQVKVLEGQQREIKDLVLDQQAPMDHTMVMVGLKKLLVQNAAQYKEIADLKKMPSAELLERSMQQEQSLRVIQEQLTMQSHILEEMRREAPWSPLSLLRGIWFVLGSGSHGGGDTPPTPPIERN